MPQQRSTGRDGRPATPQRRPPRSAARRKRERRREAERQRTAAVPRWRRLRPVIGAGATVVVVAVVLAIVLTRGHPSSTPPHGSTTPAPTPVPAPLAPLDTAATGNPVAGMACGSPSPAASPSTATPSTAHLAVFVDGAARQVPPGVGIAPPRQTTTTFAGPLVSGKCSYPLYTQTQDGIIHVQPQAAASYTLGSFFDVWGQPLSATQAGPATGPVTVFVNGSTFTGDPRSVPLSQHAVIQIDVGTAVPSKPYTFPAGE
jgi:hypothetical protein